MSSTDPDPRCTHTRHARRVTNVRDGEDWRNRAMRSTWVCDRRPCVLDAMAWVERAEAGDAIVYDNQRIEVSL